MERALYAAFVIIVLGLFALFLLAQVGAEGLRHGLG